MIYLVANYQKYALSNGTVIASVAVVLAVAIAFYALRSIGLYSLAKRKGVKCAFISFIPIAWIYVLASLAGNVNFFGRPIKNFVLIATVIFAVSEVISIATDVIAYAPLVGYYLQGFGGEAEIYYVANGNAAFNGAVVSYPFVSGVYTATNFAYPYGDFIVPLYNALGIVGWVFSLLSFVVCLVAYLGLFKTYWPEHYFLGAILSVFHLFPIFVFVIRNKEAVDFNEFMKSRFNAYYSGYGRNGYNGGYEGQGEETHEKEEPFGEFDAKDSGEKESDDPFDEFK